MKILNLFGVLRAVKAMNINTLRSFGIAFLRSLMILIMGVALAIGITPTSVLAAETAPVDVTSVQPAAIHIALAASSRFAAPTDEELDIQKMSERRREKLREQRREWQNQASEAAAEEAEQERMAADTDEDKLNLEEIAEENPVTN
jgi:hypothetical protein